MKLRLTDGEVWPDEFHSKAEVVDAVVAQMRIDQPRGHEHAGLGGGMGDGLQHAGGLGQVAQRHVAGRIVMVDLDADPEMIATLVEGVRIFAGYSGWTIGQLEGEIERDDWIVLSALPSDVLVQPRVDLWSRVLRRQPLSLAMLATHPIDLSRN
jgi:putative AlgH/UPF0301 family transcriptional regulator